MTSMGARIKALREAQGLSITEAARRIGIKQPSMSNIESGKTVKLRGDTLSAICRVFGASPDFILRGYANSTEATLMESELVRLWRAMPEDQRPHVLAVIRAMAKEPPRPHSAPDQAAEAAASGRSTSLLQPR